MCIRDRTTHEAGTSSQAPPRATRVTCTSRASAPGNAPHPLGLVHPTHIEHFNRLSSQSVVATCYYDEELLAQMGLLQDIRWLFASGGMGQFVEMKNHTYRHLTIEFLSTLHVQSLVELNVKKVTSHFICRVNFMN